MGRRPWPCAHTAPPTHKQQSPARHARAHALHLPRLQGHQMDGLHHHQKAPALARGGAFCRYEAANPHVRAIAEGLSRAPTRRCSAISSVLGQAPQLKVTDAAHAVQQTSNLKFAPGITHERYGVARLP